LKSRKDYLKIQFNELTVVKKQKGNKIFSYFFVSIQRKKNEVNWAHELSWLEENNNNKKYFHCITETTKEYKANFVFDRDNLTRVVISEFEVFNNLSLGETEKLINKDNFNPYNFKNFKIKYVEIFD
jgi:hypothetical protein